VVLGDDLVRADNARVERGTLERRVGEFHLLGAQGGDASGPLALDD
jgi:hypothetical protein